MLELLAWLRARGFKTYVSSGSGVEFLRTCTEKLYPNFPSRRPEITFFEKV
jgi:phosphoserine phosphatase